MAPPCSCAEACARFEVVGGLVVLSDASGALGDLAAAESALRRAIALAASLAAAPPLVMTPSAGMVVVGGVGGVKVERLPSPAVARLHAKLATLLKVRCA